MTSDVFDVLDEIDDHLDDLDFEGAEQTYAEAMETFGDEPELIVVGAEIAFERQDWELCIERVEAGVDDVPEEFEAELLGFKGYSLFYSDRDDRAREVFNEAVGLDSNAWMALVGRATVHEHLGYLQAALLDLDRAIEIDDQEAEPFAIRGSVHLQIGNLAEAERDLGFAVEIDPFDEASRLALARLQAVGDRASDAIETLEPLLEDGEDPDYLMPAALLRSQMSLTLGSTEAAAEDAEAAIEAYPELPWGYLQLAAVHLRASKGGDAIAALKEAEQRIDDPRDVPDLYALRASAYEQLGKTEKVAENRDRSEGAARLPEVVYGPELNPAANVPVNPERPVDVRTVLGEIFGDPDEAPPGYADKVRELLDRVSDVAEQNPDAGQVEIELPPIQEGGESPGQLVLQLG